MEAGEVIFRKVMRAFEDKDKVMVAGGRWQAQKGKKWRQPQGCDRKWDLGLHFHPGAISSS